MVALPNAQPVIASSMTCIMSSIAAGDCVERWLEVWSRGAGTAKVEVGSVLSGDVAEAEAKAISGSQQRHASRPSTAASEARRADRTAPQGPHITNQFAQLAVDEAWEHG